MKVSGLIIASFLLWKEGGTSHAPPMKGRAAGAFRALRSSAAVAWSSSSSSSVFAVGSIVRATLRPVTASGKAPAFLPYEVLEAVRGGDMTVLMRLAGSFVVPKSLLRTIAPALGGVGPAAIESGAPPGPLRLQPMPRDDSSGCCEDGESPATTNPWASAKEKVRRRRQRDRDKELVVAAASSALTTALSGSGGGTGLDLDAVDAVSLGDVLFL